MLPWWQDRANRDPDSPTSDCTRCMNQLTRHSRQLMGCGFETALVQIRRSIWSPPASRVGYSGEPPTVCPGYTTNLPEVIEAARARGHWSKGELAQFAGGQATDHLLTAIEILDAACHQYERWALTPAKDGGGREVSS